MDHIGRSEDLWSIRSARFVTTYLFKLLRFPCYDHDQLLKQLDRFVSSDDGSIPRSDIRAYLESSTQVKYRKIQLVLKTTIIFLIAKNLYFPYLTVTMVNYEDFWTTIQYNTSIEDDGYGPYYFLICLYSNCTQFTQREASEVKDMRHFPVLPICFPNLNQFYPPTTWLAPYALVLHVLLATAFFFVAFLLPLYTNSHPTTCDALMFLTAPNLTKRIVGAKVFRIYTDLRTSYQIFKIVMIQMRSDKSYKLSLAPRPIQYGSHYSSQYYHKSITSRTHRRSEVHIDRTGFRQWDLDYEFDCLPRIRADNWLKKGSLQFSYGILTYMAITGCLSTIIIYDLYVRCSEKAAEHIVIRNQIVRSGCKHFQIANDGSRHYIQPDEWLFDFGYIALADNLIICTMVFISASLLSAYYLVITELNDFRAELEYQCKILSFATYFILYEFGANNNMNSTSEKSVFELIEILEEHIKKIKNLTVTPKEDYLIRIRALILRRSIHTPYDIGIDRTHRDQRAFTMASIGDKKLLTLLERSNDNDNFIGLERYIVLMEKFYISFRLFQTHVRECSSTTLPLAFISHGQSFGLIAATLWHSHTVKKFTFEHLMLTAFNCTFSMVVVIILSNFHAKVSS